jgi:uncharacterized protein YigA (DUF484 family)
MKPDPSNLDVIEPLNDETVSKYLIENPEFFDRKADLLLALTIPHESGSAISLLERQVALFRERNRELQNNINEFIFNAEENDALFEKTRIVILELLKTDSLSTLSDAVDDTLKAEFAAHASRLFFITEDGKDMDNDGVRTLDITPARETLGKLFDKKRTFCCELTPEQARLLFPDTKKEILSAAVIPVHLGEALQEEKGIGMPILVIGSDRHNHFNSSLDTLFLDFIGEILAAHITRLEA